MPYQSLSDLLDAKAMQQAQIGAMGQESQLRNLQMQTAMDDRAQKSRLRDLFQQLPEGSDPSSMIPLLMRQGPEGMALAGQLHTMYAKDNKPMVVGRSLMKPDGTIVGTDSTWADEQKAGREAKMAELQIRMQDNATSRADRLAMQREMAQMRFDQMKESNNIRRDALIQGGKPPSGYRSTQDGNLEAIPGGPADLKAQAIAGNKAAGASDVDLALSTLRDAYNRLDEGGGITSTNKNPVSNAGAYLSSSVAGQVVGKMLGTNNQSARNDIAMTRPALLAALMKATGMSAKQMDSNAELKLWLATATDPTLDVESNRRALDKIEKKYIPSGSQPTQPQPSATQAQPNAQPQTAASLPNPAQLPNGAIVTDSVSGQKMMVNNGKYQPTR